MSNRNSLLSCVGKTPLVSLRFSELKNCGQVWGKLEFMNPGGSIKDRMCLSIIENMERAQGLRRGDSLVEASCGNTALSLAIIAAAKGYSLKLVMPDTVEPERKRLLASYGAQIVLTPTSSGMRGAVHRALEIHQRKPRTFMINQFENPANPEIHRMTTAAEILEALGSVPDVFVAGVGTGGTITGVGEAFKERNSSVRIVAVEPSESPVLSGGNPGPHMIPGIGAGFVPSILNTEIIDEVAVVSYEDAVATVTMLAASQGIYAGLSSGAALHIALREAARLEPEQAVVSLVYDSGERYLCFGS
jgi:cysteine synthase A